MTFLKTILATAAIAGFATTAAAQDTGAYVNVGVDAVEFDAYTLSGKLGYNFTENFAVEGQAAFGISDDEDDDGDTAGVDNSFGAFVKAGLPLDGGAEIFVRGGYHFTKLGGEIDGDDVSANTDGVALGVGGQYMFGGLNGVRLEYTYFDVESVGGDIFSLSYVRKF